MLCTHENRAEWGKYALCFDCGAERGDSVACPVCWAAVDNFAMLVAHLGGHSVAGGIGV